MFWAHECKKSKHARELEWKVGKLRVIFQNLSISRKFIQKNMGDKGDECYVLPNYLIKNEEPVINKEKSISNGDAPTVPDEKNDNKNGKGEKKKKGRNKNRPPPMKFSCESKLCPTLSNVQENKEALKCTFHNCKFQHNPEEYLQTKQPDISENCHIFNTYGVCEIGLSCRFASMHIKDKKFNIVNPDLSKNGSYKSHEKNNISRELKEALRKKRYDFKTDAIVDRVYRERDEAKKKAESENSQPTTSEKMEADSNQGDEPPTKKVKVIEGTIETNDAEPKKIDWNDKLYLAPLTTVGNMPFRRICKKYGCDITCGEMAMTQQILQGNFMM